MNTVNPMKPLILFATERSGTNLLRRIVDAHSKIASPPPSGLIASMAYQRFRYLNNYFEGTEKSCVIGALKLIKYHPSDWGMNISVDVVLSRMESSSFWEIFRVLNEIYAEQHEASYWFSKEPETLKWGYELLMHIPDAKFIYLVRDGRDVASSMLKGGLHEQHIYGAAKRWNHDQIQVLQYLSDPVMKERIFVIRYEDLIADSEAVIKGLFEFIGCEYEGGVLHSERRTATTAHSERSMFWNNISAPIMSGNAGKYRSRLTVSQIRIFEYVNRDILSAFSYKPDYTGTKRITGITKLFFHLQTYYNRIENRFNVNIKKEYKIRKDFNETMKKINSGFNFDNE